MAETATQALETAAVAPAVTTVATLGPAVRLVVFKFLMRSGLVPAFVPHIPVSRTSQVPTAQGREVLPSTYNAQLGNLVAGLCLPRRQNDYEFVGARVVGERTSYKTKMVNGRPIRVEVKTSDARFTFCHRQHLNDNPSHSNFVQKKREIAGFFRDMVTDNLWSVQVFLNPYLNPDGTKTKDSVLMFNCAGRVEAVEPDGSPKMVYQGGHDELGRGIGLRVHLTGFAHQLNLDGKDINLLPPSYA